VARCTIERLMRRLGLQGARRGKIRRTTVPDPSQPKPGDLLKRDFTAVAPNTRWVVEYPSIAYTREVEIAGATMSTGTVGDSYDNALAETTIGIYKTELVARQGPWTNPNQLEIATLEWVDWSNHRRLHEACGYRPPAEHEALYYIEHHAEATVATAQ
jgi:transposase InsO family protein